MLPSLLLLSFQFHLLGTGTPPNRAIVISIMAVSMLIGLLVVTLYAGYLQVIDATARGLPARATGIFDPYRQGGALRLIGYGLALVLTYLALVGIIIPAHDALIVPIYVVLILAVFAAMFGMMYYLWRDVCGGDPLPGTAPAIDARAARGE